MAPGGPGESNSERVARHHRSAPPEFAAALTSSHRHLAGVRGHPGFKASRRDYEGEAGLPLNRLTRLDWRTQRTREASRSLVRCE